MNFKTLYSKHPWVATAVVLLAVGVAGFAVAHLVSGGDAAKAAFTCPTGTECPYDTNGNFIGYKNAWPTGCQTIIPGAVSNPSKNMYNPLDLRSSTTAPQCYPTDVSAFGFTYYGRGHRMRNIGTYIDRNGCTQKFNANGSFVGNECGLGQVNTNTMQTTATAVTAIAMNSSFKYAASDTVYYLTTANCKESYMSMATLAAWGLTIAQVATVPDFVQYPTCIPSYVRLPEGSIATGDGVTMYLIRGNYKYVFTNYDSFLRQGYSVDRAIRIPQAELNAYQNGSSIN